MVVFYLIAISLLFFGVRVSKKGTFHADFLSKEQSNAIKGFFILMVFVSHFINLLKVNGFDFSANILDSSALWFQKQHMQLIVAMFLFYSGYGVMESIKSRGEDYLKAFPRKRILNTLLNFDVAVVIFIVVNLLIGIDMKSKQILLSFVGWKTVGNPSWYIFVILCCYLASYVFFKMFGKNRILAAVSVAVSLVALQLFLFVFKSWQYWWYDTIMCYSLGIFFSLFKNKIVPFCLKYYWWILVGLLALFAVMCYQNFMPELYGFTFNFKAMVFALLLVQITMKVKIENKVLIWCGLSLFPIYIYHCLPMVSFSKLLGTGWVCGHAYMLVLMCIAITFIITYCYRYWQIKFK